MGILYTVLPLSSEVAEWLTSEGFAHPNPVVGAIFPTPCEVRSVLQESGFDADMYADPACGEWSAHITSSARPEAWASLRISDYSTDDLPHALYFPKGWSEAVFEVVERRTHHCGTMVVVDDSSMDPVVVRPGDLIEDLVSKHSVE